MSSVYIYLLLSLLLFLKLCSAFLSAGSRAPASLMTMGIRSFLKRTFLPSQQERTVNELKKGIAGFYDETTGVWLDVWGDHLHHGYYPSPNYKNHSAAQSDMVDRALSFSFGGTHKVRCSNMVDVGCGVGGSSRHIAAKVTECKGVGVSLSPYQISVANELTKQAGLSDRLNFQVADAMDMPFEDNSFDLTWSMESGEHMPDKEAFLKELLRVTMPGGRIIIVTWCHRELLPGETSLTAKEERLLARINKVYYLPPWVPPSRYIDLANSMGLEDVRAADWSDYVIPFWPAVFKSALVPRNFFRMIRSGKTAVKGAIAGLWMLQGFKRGVVKFAVITARKKGPADVEV